MAGLVVGALGLAVAGCAGAPGADGERIVELRSGRTVSRDELLAAIRGADWVLLGEMHDNGLHHVRRGELIAALRGSRAAVVAEHLTRGLALRAGDTPLRERLAAAGFDARGWGWPLHEPLFASVERAGLPLLGGNLARDAVRRIAHEGEAALPPDIAAVLAAAPLSPPAREALDDDLLGSHCGMLAAAQLPAMRLAQRARDASMWLALQQSGGHPAVLLAGNGHVRRDYGVPQLAAALAPAQRLVSVGFGEFGEDAQGPYDYLWLTPPAQREDPCAGMRAGAMGAGG